MQEGCTKEESYAVFDISGITAGLNSESNGLIELPECYRPLKSIQLMRDGGKFPEIRSIKAVYESGTKIDGKILDDTRILIEKFILCAMTSLDADINSCSAECRMYSELNDDTASVKLFDRIRLRESVKIFSGYGLEAFSECMQEKMLWNDEDGLVLEDFELLKAIANVKDPASKYLLGYQVLMELVMELNGSNSLSQKKVTEFILNSYNPSVKCDAFKIRTKPTRRQGANYDEDSLTWFRNILGHPPVSEADRKALQGINLPKTLIGLTRRLWQVLLFAVRQKFDMLKNSLPS